MEKHTKSKITKNNKQKIINHKKTDNDDTISSSSSSSSHSILSIDPNEPLVNNIAHNLYILAIKQEQDERRQLKIRQQYQKKISTSNEQQLILKKSKKKLTINDIDRLFEEKRLRPSTIKNDLIDLYQKSTNRIRSMLDIHQIDQFIQITQNRNKKNHLNK